MIFFTLYIPFIKIKHKYILLLFIRDHLIETYSLLFFSIINLIISVILTFNIIIIKYYILIFLCFIPLNYLSH